MLRCSEWCGLLRLSFVFITIGGSLDSNARTFCRIIEDRRGRGRIHWNMCAVVLEQRIGGSRAASTKENQLLPKNGHEWTISFAENSVFFGIHYALCD